MTSIAEICNLALSHIGHSDRIEDINDDSAAAESCALFYPSARDIVLRSATWPFAGAWRQLTALPSVPTEEFKCAYTMPSDCLKPILVGPSANITRCPHNIPFRTASSDSATILLTDLASPCWLHYTKRLEDVTFMPVEVYLAISYQLAVFIAKPLGATDAVRNQAIIEAKSALRTAVVSVFNEVRQDLPPADEALRDRII